MEKRSISDSEASENFGIRTDHERMPNGEFRFRLTCTDGNDYIRTVAGQTGAWQKGHSHATLRETYIVESGWMVLAEESHGQVSFKKLLPGDRVTTEPTLAHNVYLPAGAVIHAVKHGSSDERDWRNEPKITELTTNLSEYELLNLIETEAYTGGTILKKYVDPRFDSYVQLYNNLDNLIWRIPDFLATGAAILIGFAGSMLSKETLEGLPSAIFVILFFFVGLLFFLSAYSLARIREHHTMAGDELARMEPDGYFHRRRGTVARRWPPSAPHVFRWTFSTLATLFWILTIAVLAWPAEFLDLFRWTS